MNANLLESRAQRLSDATVIAIFRMREPEHAIEGARAVVRGGFEAVEITMNSPGAADTLVEIAGRIDAIVGAGTVLAPEQVKEAYDAGAEYIVTPTVSHEVIEAAHGLALPVIMGASTPTEILHARRGGADWVKVFPAETLGGPDYIEFVLGPLDDIPLMVTGGLTPENYLGYLDAGAELVGFTGAVCSADAAAAGRYEEIERRAIEVVRRLDEYLTDDDEE
jgi:2-dehydro-3-deoxyphosphogluconate aldolase/(4S)-4-hydroxy-2-oxoglutarate aldolase